MSLSDRESPGRFIDELAIRLIDRGLESAQQIELLKQMHASDELCDRFIEHAMLHASLRMELGSHRPETLSESLFGAIDHLAPAPLPVTTAEVHPLSVAVDPAPLPNQYGGGTFGGVFLAFAIVASGLGAWSWWNRPPSATQAPEAAIADVCLATPVANQTATPGSTIRLESGIAKVILPNVGYVVVEGPASLELVNAMRARLSSGRIKMRITEQSGRGFVVETPYGEITDLGTEFGVDLTERGRANLVVFEGAVDLRMARIPMPAASEAQRLVGGEGVVFDGSGSLDRIESILVQNGATFLLNSSRNSNGYDPLITEVTDNLRAAETRKFYQIVPRGLSEDVLAYVDRPEHEWNGVDQAGMPTYLLGADYVKTFNNDKIRRDVKISVTLSRPARLFIFLDHRVTPPGWLLEAFHDTGDKIGLDNGRYYDPVMGTNVLADRATGPGNKIDVEFSVWERSILQPGVVELGSNAGPSMYSGMYGIAAVELQGLPEPFQEPREGSSDPPAPVPARQL